MTMNTRGRAFGPLIAALLALATPLVAHHGDAAYSATPMEMKGCVVTEFSWMNPHSLIKFDYKTAGGVRLEGAGIKPDTLSTLTRADIYSRHDRALERAIDLLK